MFQIFSLIFDCYVSRRTLFKIYDKRNLSSVVFEIWILNEQILNHKWGFKKWVSKGRQITFLSKVHIKRVQWFKFINVFNEENLMVWI